MCNCEDDLTININGHNANKTEIVTEEQINCFKRCIDMINKLKDNDNMFDVSKIKVGDVVKTIDDCAGYVKEVTKDFVFLRFLDKDGKLCSLVVGRNNYDINSFYLKQIGTYKFDEEQKCIPKVEKLHIYENELTTYDNINNVVLVNKINEIIDYLNKE